MPKAAGDIAVTVAVFPCLLWLSINAQVPLRMQRAMAWLGAISYPVYAVHLPIMVVSIWFVNPNLSVTIRAFTLLTVLLVAVKLANSPLSKGFRSHSGADHRAAKAGIA